MGAFEHPVIIDATVLSNFASTDSISVLLDQLDSPVVTATVREELEDGVRFGHGYLESALAAFEDSVRVIDIGANFGVDVDEHPLRDRLDAGETASIITALEYGGTVATDDLAARRVAEDRGVEITGSIGLLVLAVDDGVVSVDRANAWLETWREERGYYAPVERIDSLLD